MRRSALLPLVLASACFDPDPNESGGPATETSTDTTTTDGPGTTPTESSPTSSSAATTPTTTPTSAGTETDPTTDATESTTEPTTSETDPSGSESSSTGPVAACGNGTPEPGELCFAEYTDHQTVNPPWRLSVGDVDGNGHLDVVSAEPWDAESHTHLGGGAGTFNLLAGDAFGPPQDVDLGDFNGDGSLDFAFAADSDGATILHQLNTGSGAVNSGAFGPAYTNLGVGGVAGAVGDLDGDTVDDYVMVMTSTIGTGNTGLYAVALSNDSGLAAPTIIPMASVTSGDIMLADFNGDGELDIASTRATAGQPGTVLVRLGNGNGTFSSNASSTVGQDPTFITSGDFDADGNVDVAVSAFADDEISVLFGQGNGAFDPVETIVVGAGPQGIASADLDNDGVDDLVVAHMGEDSVGFVVSNGDHTFADPTVIGVDAAGRMPRGIAVGDFNEDGVPDVVVANSAYAADTATFGIFLSDP